MRTESDLTQKLLQAIRLKQPTWTIIKHCDRFTTGIPDFSVSLGLHTIWVEVKLLRKRGQDLWLPKTWVDNYPQLELLTRLQGLYLVRDSIIDQTMIVSAHAVREALASEEALSVEEQAQPGHGIEELEQLIKEGFNGHV